MKQRFLCNLGLAISCLLVGLYHLSHPIKTGEFSKRSLKSSHHLNNKKDFSSSSSKGYNILAMGGSVTWGMGLENRHDAYPYLLGQSPNNVDNVAIRATGAEYFSKCIKSLIGDENNDKVYDIILLEFSLNGRTDLEILLKRLRTRFPDAVIIYVHLYSFMNSLEDEKGKCACSFDTKNPSKKWYWRPSEKHLLKFQEVKKEFDPFGVIEYKFLKPDRPEDAYHLFAQDWQHLSAMGHRLVRDAVLSIIAKLEQEGSLSLSANKKPRLGSWGNGDQCYSWFETGESPILYHKAVMNKFTKSKHAMEFREPGGSITLSNPYPYPVPLYLSFMAKSNFYPKTMVQLGKNQVKIDTDPHNGYHITKQQMVGMVSPGENVLSVIPEANPSSNNPFRLTGAMLCGVCVE